MTTFAIKTIDANGVAVFQNGTGNADPLNVWLERAGVLVSGSWGEADANAQGWTYVGAQTGDVPFAQRLNATTPVKGPPVPAPVPPPPPPPPTGVQVSATPSLPAAVFSALGPLKIALLEGFAHPSQGGVALGAPGAMFGPNWTSAADPEYPFNPNERAVFKQDHATLLPGGGLDLACTNTPGIGAKVAGANAACNYTSGCASCLYADATAGGSPGFPIRGFKRLPQPGMTTVVEFDITIPPYLVGLDFGLWWQGAKGQGEIDEFELMDETVGKPGTSAMILNIIDHVTGAASPTELQVFNSSFLKTGGRGKLTFVETGVTSIAAYLTPHGGAPALMGSAKFPAWTVTEPMACVLSFSLRDIEADENPTWTADQHVQVWSAFVGATALNGFYEGGTAQGTTPA